MHKLLVNAPTGLQEVLEVDEGGGYFDAGRVLWDERKDGPMPTIELGAMKRQAGALKTDAALLAADQARRAEAAGKVRLTVEERLSLIEAALGMGDV